MSAAAPVEVSFASVAALGMWGVAAGSGLKTSVGHPPQLLNCERVQAELRDTPPSPRTHSAGMSYARPLVKYKRGKFLSTDFLRHGFVYAPMHTNDLYSTVQQRLILSFLLLIN